MNDVQNDKSVKNNCSDDKIGERMSIGEQAPKTSDSSESSEKICEQPNPSKSTDPEVRSDGCERENPIELVQNDKSLKNNSLNDSIGKRALALEKVSESPAPSDFFERSYEKFLSSELNGLPATRKDESKSEEFPVQNDYNLVQINHQNENLRKSSSPTEKAPKVPKLSNPLYKPNGLSNPSTWKYCPIENDKQRFKKTKIEQIGNDKNDEKSTRKANQHRKKRRRSKSSGKSGKEDVFEKRATRWEERGERERRRERIKRSGKDWKSYYDYSLSQLNSYCSYTRFVNFGSIKMMMTDMDNRTMVANNNNNNNNNGNSSMMIDGDKKDDRNRNASAVRRRRSRSPIDRNNHRAESKASRRVYVANVAFDVKWSDLKDLFREKVGNVVYCQLFEDEKGQSRGCGLVEFTVSSSWIAGVCMYTVCVYIMADIHSECVYVGIIFSDGILVDIIIWIVDSISFLL